MPRPTSGCGCCAALTEADRAKGYAMVQQKVSEGSTCGYRCLTSTWTRWSTRRSRTPARTCSTRTRSTRGWTCRFRNRTRGSNDDARHVHDGRSAAGCGGGDFGDRGADPEGQRSRLDAPHYDGQRTTWSPTSDIVNMFQDTLVALDWDGKTAIPIISPSPGPSVPTARRTPSSCATTVPCSGKKFTAADGSTASSA